MSWQQLLEGDDAERALAAARAVAADLAAVEPDGPGFNAGHAARAVLGVHLARVGDSEAGERAVDSLEQALDSIDRAVHPWFLDGLAGIAWTVAHLMDLVDIDDDTLDQLDSVIGRVLAIDPWTQEWEYVLGLTGLAVYGLERPGAPGDAIVARAVQHLAALAERGDGTITWRSPPTLLLDPAHKAENPDGYYNAGLAHGVVGVIMLLAEASARGVAGADELLPGAIAWLQAQDSGNRARRFPLMIARGLPQTGLQRDGWCYGDQAAGAALVRAGQVASRADWIDHGLSAAREVARREPTMALDAGFCHGTLGRAHMFNRLAQATGDDELAEAARRWYRITLERRVEGAGLGGFVFPERNADPASVLTGSVGIALGLVAAASPIEPGWDRAFLCALPPRVG